MAERRLSRAERALWMRVVADVRPMEPLGEDPEPPAVAPPPSSPRPTDRSPGGAVSIGGAGRSPTSSSGRPDRSILAATLDGGWDRRLAQGRIQPDRSIDLHGHTLASAHAALIAALDRAVAAGDRVLLVVTGRPPRAGVDRPYARGAIRAAIADWLALSRHADRIAAVRNAAPRHGGSGAIYIILRRARDRHPIS